MSFLINNDQSEEVEVDYNFADLLQLFGQWLVSTGDFITLAGQTIAIEQDRQERIQDIIDQQEQELEKQQMQQQLDDLQEQIKQLQSANSERVTQRR
ncbi:hypothetical protein LF817_13155 [Halobacillus sp. A1]|uniref:hypothetical protein n=1 Tax=Halobacillus sp. A1 TaxID=2880262 RepID=UPI0020A667CA|nr:hypothetical protein [Halobacillus sp. A1]MCP3032289.1 hypothetical protein [Halobacillus sp. A1]